MRPSDVSDTLSDILGHTLRPCWIWGPPGCGKSDLGRQAAAACDISYQDFRPLLHDPSDLKFPMVDIGAKTIEWVNSVFPKDPEWAGIIALEEVGLCPPLMQGALYQLALERQIGEYRLPKGARVIAISNRQEDKAGVVRQSTALLNRFVHLDLEVSNDDWQAWAVDAGIAVEVRSFLNFRPELLLKFDPKLNERAFPSPRSWAFVNEILPHVRERLQHQVFSGTVGEGAAVEFLAFLQVYRDLPDLDAVWKTPLKVAIPSAKPAVMFALTGALADQSKSKDNLDPLAQFYCQKGMPEEFSALALRDTFLTNSVKKGGKPVGAPKLFKGEMSKWLARHRDVLLSRE
jgi:MoxR-like ATPase